MSPVKRTPWTDRSQIARRFAAARILRGLEPKELDALLYEAGVTKGERGGMTGRMENDQGKPHPAVFEAMIEVLGASPEWFTAPVENLLRPIPTPPKEELERSQTENSSR